MLAPDLPAGWRGVGGWGAEGTVNRQLCHCRPYWGPRVTPHPLPHICLLVQATVVIGKSFMLLPAQSS